MARTPKTNEISLTASELDEGRLQEAEGAAQQLGVLQAQYGEGRDFLNQAIGRAQAQIAIRDFANVMTLAELKKVKENKLYRAAEGQKAYDRHGVEIPNVGTWDGFCRAVGVSVAKADEDITNFNAFGEEALSSMQMAGIGYRDLRKFRRLGDDEKTLLIEAAKSGDKDSLVEFAETLISKHTKEKETLSARVTDLEADLEGAREYSKEKENKINELTRKVKRFNVDVDLPVAFAEASATATEAVNTILTQLQKLEDLRDQAMNQMRPEDEHGQAVHLGELQSLGMVMFGGYTAINAKLKTTETVFNETLEKLLAN